MLVGVRDSGGGLGNNADEITTAFALFQSTVIELYQDEIIDALKQILAVNQITLDLYFKPATPLALLKNLDTTNLSEEIEAVNPYLQVFIDAAESDEDLAGYNLVDAYEVDADDDINFEVELKVDEPTVLQQIINLVSTGRAYPEAKSKQDQTKDGNTFLTRYRYTECCPSKSGKERSFCKAMMSANKLYRKEDIERMGKVAVNPGFGPKGSDTYSIWKFHGGVSCSHSWRRELYLKKLDSNETQKISRDRAVKMGYKIIKNPIEVATPTCAQPHGGSLDPKRKPTC
jgi:hypothetical protein